MTAVFRHGIRAAVLFNLLAVGCGGAQSKGGEFPSRGDLGELTASPPPAKINLGEKVDVTSWTLSGPLPEAIDDAAEDGSTPWGKALVDAAATRQGAVVPTKAMGCAAREAALFVLAHKTAPGRAVSRFIAGRCGVPTSFLRVSSVSLGNVPAGKSDGEVWDALRGDVGRMLQAMGPARQSAGIALARSGDRAGVVLASAPRRVRLERTSLIQSEGTVVLRGELLEPAQSIRALVTAGNFGFSQCTQDVNVDLPRFAIQCPVAKADAAVSVELVGFPAGRVLGDTLLEAVVFPAEPALAFTGSTAPDANLADDKGAIGRALADRINAVRNDAGMPPLRVSPRESVVADRLASYYFAATTGALDDRVADKVALGLMAGWDVEGEVRDGHFSSAAYGYRDPARLLEELSARPFGRETLFDPRSSALALGVFSPSDGGLGAIIGTYSLFDGSTSNPQEMGQIVDRLTRLRRAKGLPPPRLITELDEDARRAAGRVRQGTEPREAMDDMIRDTATRLRSGGVKGWMITGPTVESLEIPSELLSWPNLPIAISVAHHRPAGHPWLQLTVFVVVVHFEGMNTAQIGRPRGG